MAIRQPHQSTTKFTEVFEVDTFPAATGLVGYKLGGQWEIKSLLHSGPQQSGGNFGLGYVVYDAQNNLERFLKVVDFRKRLRDPSKLAQLLNEAQFEIDIHRYCGARRMSKVVQMISHGDLIFRRRSDGEEYSFICILMERGEGDIKNHVDYAPNQSPYWKLCVLRDVALAVVQIERANLAHNDVKPSNVIRFQSIGDQHSVKLGDVGRAVRKDGQGPFDGLDWAGDPRHKPIEVLYGWKEPEWQDRRTAADAYMLGNLIAFLFVGASLTERIINSLPQQYHPFVHGADYRQVLPIIRHTWTVIVKNQIVPAFPHAIRAELESILCWLTEPDPRIRGDAAARRSSVVGVDRIHSRLMRLAQKASIQERMGRAP